MASIQEIIEQWKKALKLEVNELKTRGGSRVTITDGKCLQSHEKGATYWFSLASDVFLPEGTPIRVEYKTQSFLGRIVSAEGFDVILELDAFIGNQIDEAYLFSEPWELLEALSKRLEETDEHQQNRMKRLLSGRTPAKHPEEKAKNPVQDATLRTKYNPVTYIWGPPGTGKTYTLARMIAQHYLWGKKVLVMAHSNAAVDVLLLEIAEVIQKKQIWKPGDILRYGFSTDPKVKEHHDLLALKLVETNNPAEQTKIRKLESEKARLLQIRTSPGKLAQVANELKGLRGKIAQEEAQFVQQAAVVGVTLSKAALDPVIYEQDYDLVVVDEVSMSYIPQVAFAASLGKRIVVCGDFKQLPPIALSESKLADKWLKHDIFHGAKIAEKVERGEEHPNLLMLKEQRRMHPEISRFTNTFIYKNRVYDHENVLKNREKVSSQHPFPNEAAALVDISKMGAYCLIDSETGSRFNLMSALLSMQLILSGKANGIHSIGFISPYKAQARLLATLIQELIPDQPTGNPKVIAATVHKFQGSERDMMVFDYTDSYPRPQAGILLTDEKSDRLINVAVTRARGKLISIVDRHYIESRISKTKAAGALIDYTNHQYSRHELPSFIKENYHENLHWFGEADTALLLKEIKNAKQIIVSAPFPSKIESSLWNALQMAGRVTFITTRKESIPMHSFDVIESDVVMPFMIINEEIIWTGVPVSHNSNLESSPESPYIHSRLVSKRVVKLIRSYLNLGTATRYSNERDAQKFKSTRPSFMLGKYIASWDQCPACKSRRKAEMTPGGKILLVCNYCGSKGGVSKYLLQKYIDYVDLKCTNCNEPFEASGERMDVLAECCRCNEKVDVHLLW